WCSRGGRPDVSVVFATKYRSSLVESCAVHDRVPPPAAGVAACRGFQSADAIADRLCDGACQRSARSVSSLANAFGARASAGTRGSAYGAEFHETACPSVV